MTTTAAQDTPRAPEEPAAPAHQGTTAVLEREETSDDAGEGERFAHYVRKDRIASSAMTGRPVIALCGKVWTPRRDPSRYPVCPACKEIFEALKG